VTIIRSSKSPRTGSGIPPEFNELEEMFNEAFKLLDLFQSTARMKMLLMMSRGPVDTTVMRKTVNPKLVYENISLMKEKKLIEEVDERGFNLTEIGKRVLMEYLQFLENLERTMWET